MGVSRSGPCLPDTTSVPPTSILRSLLFDPGTDFSYLHDLNQVSNCAPVEEVLCNFVTVGYVLCKHTTEFSFLCFVLPSFVRIFFFTLLSFLLCVIKLQVLEFKIICKIVQSEHVTAVPKNPDFVVIKWPNYVKRSQICKDFAKSNIKYYLE
jgi:hypothetical protein